MKYATKHTVTKCEQVVKEFWQKAASPSCHPLRQRMDSSDLDQGVAEGSQKWGGTEESGPKGESGEWGSWVGGS